MIPMQLTVRRSENTRYSQGGVSRVGHYDRAMLGVFPYFIVADSHIAGCLSEKLGSGFSKGEYGPFWPSFASMNFGSDKYKVLWFSQAGLECLQLTAGPGFLLRLEERAPALLQAEMENF